ESQNVCHRSRILRIMKLLKNQNQSLKNTGIGGGVIRNLQNEKGVTLLEVMVTSIVIVATILSIYIGVVYAEKQVLRNYHDRVATLKASG
ncbi:MAG: hypothetical protein U1C33_06205, partial [Candidatus Cloacimonadaceae bacterium]|nr:hypothetical protein [Candidatus Cloacimonadaceae bacterium]